MYSDPIFSWFGNITIETIRRERKKKTRTNERTNLLIICIWKYVFEFCISQFTNSTFFRQKKNVFFFYLKLRSFHILHFFFCFSKNNNKFFTRVSYITLRAYLLHVATEFLLVEKKKQKKLNIERAVFISLL